MGRPTIQVEQPQPLVHLGHIETWTNYCGGQGPDYDVQDVVENKMGKRPCRWLREGDWVCVDLERVSCELCLKSKQAQAEKARRQKNVIRPNLKTAEGRLFWKHLREDVEEYERTTTPAQRFRGYVSMERGRRIKYVARIEDGKVVLT